MTSSDIRQSFLDFFKSKEHAIVPSVSLLPDSPNLLFTNAGMNQFVPYFLGEREAYHPRLANTQKCIRAGGKHNDLEDVGFDTYHHTFFEMLGNWSFNDYFKKEAISWAWELLTEVWEFPKERLYATVYKPAAGDPAEFDQEASDCWSEIFKAEGMDLKVHLIHGGKKDNFWMMGETGPCGPCSEIHMDLTEKGDTRGSLVNCESPLCIEIWNLVFIQLNAADDGSYRPLASRHVDTGLGFERVAGIIASTNNFTDFSRPPSNYESDLFTTIFSSLAEMCSHSYGGAVPANRNDLSADEMRDCAFRVLADHIRTLCCAIADGILPGNEGRNYVLRRILRRAVLWGRRLDLTPGSFSRLVDPVLDALGPVFPELSEQQDVIRKVILAEESAFDRTIDRGLQVIDKITAKNKGGISGEDAFLLYDTYGFPLDLTQVVARERNMQVDTEGFDKEMENQRKRARAARKKDVIAVSDEGTAAAATQFVGYESDALKNLETEVREVIHSNDRTYLVFPKSPFYAEMGGQVGDTGEVVLEDCSIQILDTISDNAGQYLHQVEVDTVENLTGKRVALTVNLERRLAIQRHHSATHILHWALRKVLGEHVKQAGSLVADNRLRFDFSHFEQPRSEQLHQIEVLTNQRILENADVKWHEVPFDEKPENCIAFFGEKYGNIVRVVDIGGYSLELCGGTHVGATGEIGLVKIVSESAIAAGTRRIEAVAGQTAYSLMESNYDLLITLSQKLSCKPQELEARFASLLDQRKALEKELRGARKKDVAALADDLAANASEKIGIHWVAAKVDVADPDEMRKLAVDVSQKLTAGVVALGGDFGGKASVLALCSPEAIKAGHKAGDIVRELAGQLGGKGGGKADFAMGGGKEPGKLEKVLADFLAALK